MDKKFLEKIKAKLLEEKKKLEKELESFTKKDKLIKDNYQAEFPEFGTKEDESALEVAAFSDALSLEHTLELALKDINEALERIKKGTYGICKYCGQEISKERLEVRPTSGSCIECKRKLKGEV